MQRVRKNSLSPCYTTANKENLPIDNLTSPIGISFKNLEEARKKKNIEPSVNPKMSLNQFFFKNTPISNVNAASHGHSTLGMNLEETGSKRSGKVLESARRETDKSIEDYRSSLKSKEKQMTSLHTQVNTLSSTVTLLKQQIINLKQENNHLNSENNQYKKVIKQKNQMIDKLKKQKMQAISRTSSPVPQRQTVKPVNQCLKCRDMKGKDEEYDEVIEKLNELEQVQNKLLHENQKLSKKQTMHKAMLRNFKTLLEGNRIHELTELINVLNQ